MNFTEREIKELLISIVALALMFSKFNFEILPLTIVVIVFIFASHEIIGHKYFAQRYDCSAEYRMSTMGILFGLIMAALPMGFIFAAPGAVWISPFSRNKFAFTVNHITHREYGIISAAGPLVNIAIGGIFALLNFYLPMQILGMIASFSFYIAMFNMIPFLGLDGEKVMKWSWKAWALIFAASLIGYAIL